MDDDDDEKDPPMRPPDIAALASWIGEKANARAATAATHCVALS
jgi:hypothetical protein